MNVLARSPVTSQVHLIIRQLLPVLVKIGPASFRRKVVEMIPYGPGQRMKQISDAMYERSVRIINQKRAALERGDEALKHQIGEGKDIMSVLRMSRLIFVSDCYTPLTDHLSPGSQCARTCRHPTPTGSRTKS